MVVCPAPNARVEGCDERGLITAALGADKFFHLFQVALLGFPAGRDDDLVATPAVMFAYLKLPDGETEKVKTYAAFVFVKRVGDEGFAGFQRQSHRCQPFLSQSSRGL